MGLNMNKREWAAWHYLQMRGEKADHIPEDGGHLVFYKVLIKKITLPIIHANKEAIRIDDDVLIVWNMTDLTSLIKPWSKTDDLSKWSEVSCWFSFTQALFDDYMKHEFYFVECRVDLGHYCNNPTMGRVFPLEVLGFPDRDEWIKLHGVRDSVSDGFEVF